MLRKINAVFSLLASLLLVSHSLATTIQSITKSTPAAAGPQIPTILLVAFALIHACLSMLGLSKVENGTGKYPKAHKQTIVQRSSGMLTMLLLFLHAFVNLTNPGSVLSIVSVLLIAFVAMLHAKVSIPKAFVTLGLVTKEKTVAVIERISVIFFTILTLFIFVMFITRLIGVL